MAIAVSGLLIAAMIGVSFIAGVMVQDADQVQMAMIFGFYSPVITALSSALGYVVRGIVDEKKG